MWSVELCEDCFICYNHVVKLLPVNEYQEGQPILTFWKLTRQAVNACSCASAAAAASAWMDACVHVHKLSTSLENWAAESTSKAASRKSRWLKSEDLLLKVQDTLL